MRAFQFCVILLLSLNMAAQEFVTQVTINTPKIQTADPKIFKSLKTAIEQFMNTRDWVEDEFEPAEFIDINIIRAFAN